MAAKINGSKIEYPRAENRPDADRNRRSGNWHAPQLLGATSASSPRAWAIGDLTRPYRRAREWRRHELHLQLGNTSPPRQRNAQTVQSSRHLHSCISVATCTISSSGLCDPGIDLPGLNDLRESRRSAIGRYSRSDDRMMINAYRHQTISDRGALAFGQLISIRQQQRRHNFDLHHLRQSPARPEIAAAFADIAAAFVTCQRQHLDRALRRIGIDQFGVRAWQQIAPRPP